MAQRTVGAALAAARGLAIGGASSAHSIAQLAAEFDVERHMVTV